MISPDNIIGIPAFHFNDDDPEVRSDDNKIRISIIDIGLVIDEIIVRKFFQKSKGAFLPAACLCRKTIGDAFGHMVPDEPFTAIDDISLDLRFGRAPVL
jgi:hypothetical protein